jgi:hypothetical protein
VETLDLSRRGRCANRRQAMRDSVLAAQSIEQDLDGVQTESPGEDLAVVGQHLVWDSKAL